MGSAPHGPDLPTTKSKTLKPGGLLKASCLVLFGKHVLLEPSQDPLFFASTVLGEEEKGPRPLVEISTFLQSLRLSRLKAPLALLNRV